MKHSRLDSRCGLTCWGPRLSHFQWPLQHMLKSQPPQMLWPPRTSQVWGGLLSSQMEVKPGSNFRSRGNRLNHCGHGSGWICGSTLQHGNCWLNLPFHIALSCTFQNAEGPLPATKGQLIVRQTLPGLSMTPAMFMVLSPFFMYMRRFHIYPKLSHIPGHLNIIAVALSRFQQPLPIPLKREDFCDVDSQALLESSPVVIAQTGRKSKVAIAFWH